MNSSVSSKKFIKDLPKIKKPRERLLSLGSKNLTTVELLAIILGSGNKKGSVLDLASKLIKTYPLKSLKNINFFDLIKIHGIGPANACKILACLELTTRFIQDSQLSKLDTPQKVFQISKDIRGKSQEHTLVLFLNGRQELIHQKIVAIGGLNFNLLEMRDVFAPAITLPSSFIILVHNHPSGDITASEDDIRATQRLIKAGELLGVTVLDHLIVTKINYFSFREKGMI